MSASAGTIGYRTTPSGGWWKWAALGLVSAALLGGLFIGRTLAPSPTQPVRIVERFVPVTQPGSFTSDAQEQASVKAAYGRALSGLGLRAHATAPTVNTVPAPAPLSPASIHLRQLAP
jgi:hypothetical protein